MGLVVGIDQPLPGHMGVDLGGGQAPVAQEVLDAPEVGPAVEQVGREAVAERVRARGRVEPRADQVLLEQPADAPGGQPGPPVVEEQGRLARPRGRRSGPPADRATPSPSGRPGRAARDAPCRGPGPAPSPRRGRPGRARPARRPGGRRRRASRTSPGRGPRGRRPSGSRRAGGSRPRPGGAWAAAWAASGSGARPTGSVVTTPCRRW